ncbi:MAG: TlpA family protein disulfide reductase [Candidatus Caldatribacteriaceae bacterium]
MRAYRFLFFLGISILFLFLLVSVQAQEAPSFRLAGIDGKEYSLADLRGRPVVLSFFTTWCPYCAQELPLLDKLYREYQDKASLAVLGIDLQEPKNLVVRFIERVGVSFPVLLDQKGETARAYRVLGLPTLFFIDPEGQVADMILGGSNEAVVRRKLESILWFRGLVMAEVRNLVEVLDDVTFLDLRENGTNPFPEKKNASYRSIQNPEDIGKLDPQGVYVLLPSTNEQGKECASSMARQGFRRVYYLLSD